MQRLLYLVALASLAACMFVQAQGGDAKKDKELLQGTWVLVSASAGGKDVPKPAGKEYALVFKGDKVTKKETDMSDEEVDFTIDPTKSPRHLDFKGPKGSMLCIYELQGDTLKVGVFLNGKSERPAAFGGDAAVLTLQKKKK